MNLYRVNIHDTNITGIYGETMHVVAGSAKTALEKAYRKFERKYPDCGRTLVHKLELVEEQF